MADNCVYFHINPVKQEVFYVGIGNLKRPYKTEGRNIHWKRLTNKYGYSVIILHEGLTWEEAEQLEKKYITQIGRKDLREGTLVNMTNGGDGGATWTGKTRPQETRDKISKGHKGKIVSQITRQRMGTSKLGNKYNLGRIATLEHRKNLSEAHKGQKAWNRGLKTGPLSEQDKLNKSIAAKKRWAEYKLKNNKNHGR